MAIRFDDAFAVLDASMVERSFGADTGVHRTRSPGERQAAALDEAATVAMWAATTTPEWVRAVGGIAERTRGAARASLWVRFERYLEAMAERSGSLAHDLGVVIQQAHERRMKRTVEVAEAFAARRGVSPRFEESMFGWPTATRSTVLTVDGRTPSCAAI